MAECAADGAGRTARSTDTMEGFDMRIGLIGGLALGGALLCPCAGSGPPRHAHERGRHGPQETGAPQPEPVVSAEVFLFLPYDSDHDHRLTGTELQAAIAGTWREVAGSRS